VRVTRSSLRRLAGRRAGDACPAIAINFEPTAAPWGGGNQFVELLVRHLRSKGLRVTQRLDRDVRAILLVEPRRFETTTFGVREIARFKRRHPGVPCVHRVNECDLRKATTDVDELLRRANVVADHTVFISRWLRDYFADRWFDPNRPHTVIYNAADPTIFHPPPDGRSAHSGPVRIVTHHWSSHWMKGFAVYAEVDRLIAEGKLDGFALTVVGRWPKQIEWRSATTHDPVRGHQLAHILSSQHLYLTASLWEPCGMHHIEGAQCGLPLVYHEDGGGIVELGRRYGIAFRDDVASALQEARERLPELRSLVLANAPSAAAMCHAYEELLAA
jgi:glycosyltransferase involved in cell wall biosynthesis